MIHPSGTFEYKAKFTSNGFTDSDIVLRGSPARSGEKERRLVGRNPKIRFWNDRLVLVASWKHISGVRNASFPIGDAVKLAARPGDELYLVRNGTGEIGLSVLREQRLILAIGAITDVPLGTDIRVICGSEGKSTWLNPGAKTWLEFSAQEEQLTLREREESQIGDYHIYVERCWKFGMPGTSECVSVCLAENSRMKTAAMRSAILLANGDLKMTDWNLTEHFARIFRFTFSVSRFV